MLGSLLLPMVGRAGVPNNARSELTNLQTTVLWESDRSSRIAACRQATRRGSTYRAESDSLDSVCAMAGPGKPGRRHKGARTLVQTRLPDHRAEYVTNLAEERGEYRADLVAMLLDIALEHLDELPEPAHSQDEQGRFPLAEAS